jgi:hypothetical protein
VTLRSGEADEGRHVVEVAVSGERPVAWSVYSQRHVGVVTSERE